MIELLINEIKNDPSYRETWKANIAMSFKDEWQNTVNKGELPHTPDQVHIIANNAADNFLNILIKERV